MHTNKVMNAIADCAKAVKGFTNSDDKIEIRDLKQLIARMKRSIACNPSHMNAEESSNR